MLEYFYNNVAGLKTCNFIKKRLQHRCHKTETTETTKFRKFRWKIPVLKFELFNKVVDLQLY